MDRLKGKIAVVTGAGAGIGLATARLFAAEGAHVYVTDVNGESAAEAASALKGAGLGATAMTVDVSRGQDVTALFRAIEQAHGKIDVLVNNAGLNVRADFRHLSDADWVKIREVNLDGVVRIARDGFPLLKASGAGSLINVASIMGHRGLRQLAGYSATKGAVSALTRALAVEYAPYNIRVNALAPGYIETELNRDFLSSPAGESLGKRVAMRRFGKPEDLDGALLLLASDAGRYITGATLVVDGGLGLAWL
jgi:NAD(P)-dependent dehydrogenase (short-subunit alcohol dehydrogenase family)